jgi:hypothetical protein
MLTRFATCAYLCGLARQRNLRQSRVIMPAPSNGTVLEFPMRVAVPRPFDPLDAHVRLRRIVTALAGESQHAVLCAMQHRQVCQVERPFRDVRDDLVNPSPTTLLSFGGIRVIRHSHANQPESTRSGPPRRPGECLLRGRRPSHSERP